MSEDYSALEKRVEKMHRLRDPHISPNAAYAARVENIVAQVFGLTVQQMFIKTRRPEISHARFVLFSILWQPTGFRNCGWLCRRYGRKHQMIKYAIDTVETNEKLKERQITIMALLAAQLEFELFGPRRPANDIR